MPVIITKCIIGILIALMGMNYSFMSWKEHKIMKLKDKIEVETPADCPIHFKDPQEAFEKAIKDKRLTNNPKDPNFAGNYMYMGTRKDNGVDTFKHYYSKKYIP